MAADGKGSFENEPSLSHERIGKQYSLPFGLYGNIAGVVTLCNSVMNRIFTGLEAHRGSSTLRLDTLRDAVEDARYAEFLHYVDGKMRRHLGMTVEQWQQLPSASLHYRRGQRLLNRSPLPVEGLIGGIVGSGCVIHFGLGDTACADPLACIGIGADAAYRWLVKRSQEVYMSIPRTILHIAEAMREAKLDQPKTVGDPADYVVITERQIRRMPAKDPTLQQMLAKYVEADTEEIDSSDEIWRAIQGAMYLPGISKADYENGIREAQSH
jgi:hypothetical protein